MNEDLQLVNEFGTYQDKPAVQEKNAVETFLDKPLASSEKSPVEVTAGEKVEKTIEKEKAKKSLLSTASTTKKKTEKVLGAAVPDLSELPTPPSGGIGLLIFISLLMVFAISPLKGGGTRLSKLWGAMLGNISLPAQSAAAPAPAVGATSTIAIVPDYSQLIQGGLGT